MLRQFVLLGIGLICLTFNFLRPAVSEVPTPVPAPATTNLSLQPITSENLPQISQVASIPNLGPISDIVWSPDGTLIALAVGLDIKLYDVNSLLAVKMILSGHTDTVTSIAFSKDGSLIVSGSNDGTIRIWEVVTGIQQKLLKVRLNPPYTANSIIQVNSVAFSPDRKLVAYGTAWIAEFFIWDIDTETITEFIDNPNGFTNTVIFSPDGSSIVSGGGWSSTISSWNLKSRKQLPSITGHKDWIYKLTFDLNGTLLASASWDGTIMLWNVKLNKLQAVSKNVDTWVTDVSFNHDGTLLASGELNSVVRFWDVSSATELLKLNLYPDHPMLTYVAFNPIGTLLATAYESLRDTTNQDANLIQLWGVKQTKAP